MQRVNKNLQLARIWAAPSCNFNAKAFDTFYNAISNNKILSGSAKFFHIKLESFLLLSLVVEGFLFFA